MAGRGDMAARTGGSAVQGEKPAITAQWPASIRRRMKRMSFMSSITYLSPRVNLTGDVGKGDVERDEEGERDPPRARGAQQPFGGSSG